MNVETASPSEAPQAFLDFLRAIAAFLVLLSHTRNWFFLNIDSIAHPSPILRLFWFLTVLGSESVGVFFVLSGFLVGGSIRRSMRRGNFTWTNYLIARFARIYIVYVPALVLTALVFMIGPTFLDDPGEGFRRPIFSDVQWTFGGARQALCHVAGLQGFACPVWTQNPPLWSLGYEWALYLVAPVLLGLLASRGKLVGRITGLILVLAALVAVADDPLKCAFWCSTWFLGTAAQEVLRLRRIPLAAGLTGCVVIVVGMALARLFPVHEMPADALIALGVATALACRTLVHAQWAPRFFKWAAGFSYSLYATHVPIIYLMVMTLQRLGAPANKLPPNEPMAYLGMALTVVVALLVAYAFSLFTEQRTQRLRDALTRGADLTAKGTPGSTRSANPHDAGAGPAVTAGVNSRVFDSPRP